MGRNDRANVSNGSVMPIVITHSKVNNVLNPTQAELDAQIALGNYPPGTLLADVTLASDWNDDHVISGTIDQGVPTGGTTDQVLVKSSNTDFDTKWRTLVTGVSSVFGRVGAVVADIADYAAFYIKLNGTTTTTASIPFAEGLSTGDTKTILLGSAALATARGSVTNNNAGVTMTGLADSAGLVGANLIIKAGTGPIDDANGGMLRLHGGDVGPLFDLPGQVGFVTTDTAATSFITADAITTSTTIGNTIEDFLVGGALYVQGNATFIGGIGTNGAVHAGAGYCLLASGTGVDLAIGIGRHGTAAGKNLTVHGGWARASTTNSAGGNLILAPGTATGSAIGNVVIQAVGGGSNGVADRAPTTIATWGRTVCVYNVSYVFDTALGLIIGSKTTDLVGFYGTTAVAQPAAGATIDTAVLGALGLRAASTTAPFATTILPRTGAAAAGSVPMRFTSGTLLTTAVTGGIEFLSDKYYGTITTSAARMEFTLNNIALTSGRIPFATTNGRLTDSSAFTFAGTTLTVTNIAATTHSGNLTMADAVNIPVGTGTGTRIGTAASQRIGFWNTTPIVQPTTSVAAATFVANTSAIANDTATFDGYTIGQVVRALRNAGLLT